MSWSFKLVTVRGIPIRVHLSFLLVIVWAVYAGWSNSLSGGGASGDVSWAHGALFMVAFVILLFASVVLHELGHSLVAQLFGVRVQDITLWPIGGVARMAKLPERPYQEFLIAAAGPAVNILLAGLLGAVTVMLVGPTVMWTRLIAGGILALPRAGLNAEALLLLVTANNALLALFNLLPAFPMDGGRLLRALLASFVPFNKATRVASVVGQVLAVGMMSLAIIAENYMLALVGLFVFLAAWQERQQTFATAHLTGYRVRQAMQPIGLRLHPLQTLAEVAANVARETQATYIVVDGGRLAGFVSRKAILTALRRAGPEARLQQHIERGVLQVGADDSLSEVYDQLAQTPSHAAVVTEAGTVIGTLSSVDLWHFSEIVNASPRALLPR